MTDVRSGATVVLPLALVIQIYPGFWFCALCCRPDRSGSGRYWCDTAQVTVESIGIEHLRERHGLAGTGGEVTYLSQTDLARRLNVSLATVNGWLLRYRDAEHPFPPSCAPVGMPPRWRVDQWPAIDEWHRQLRGRSTRGVFPPMGYATQSGVGAWISRSGTWVKDTREGRRAVHAPFPKEDKRLERGTSLVPLWATERRPEVIDWHDQYKLLVTSRRGRPRREREGV